MAPREFHAVEPQLKPQVGRGHDYTNIKDALVVLVPLAKAASTLLHKNKLVRFKASEVALDTAEPFRASY